DWRSSAAMLRGHFPQTPVFVPALANPRAADAGEVAAFFASVSDAPVTPLSGDDALDRALAACAAICGRPDHMALIAGSLYLLAEFFGRYPQHLAPSHSRSESLP
ncbi:MAG: bifunctional folylpolyglutamate synthase/ dihydrofolate synthase, partial [Desulfovibrio sp.]|nr:bifunctional folylpolyglutamate synthase/ dihydrofolate synthase [Desulfovibrio sp.]